MNDTFDLEFTSKRNTVAEIRLDKVLDGHSKRGTEVRVLNRLNLDVADVDDPMLDGVPWIITKQSLNNYPSDTNERRRIFSEFATRIRYVLADMDNIELLKLNVDGDDNKVVSNLQIKNNNGEEIVLERYG